MPTYLCHGFRWHRRDLRIFVIMNDLEDAAPDWVLGETTATQILDQFTKIFDFLPKISDQEAEAACDPRRVAAPSTQHHDDNFAPPPSRVPIAHDPVLQYTWSPVKLLEEYDPDETVSPARPYAYVADHVVRVDLGVDVLAEMAAYEKASRGAGGQKAWFEKLRDTVQNGADIGWHVVVCGDTAREYPDDETETGSESHDLRLQREETQRPTTTMTTTTQSTQPKSVPTAGSAHPSHDQVKAWVGQDYSHMKPPPIPNDDGPGHGHGHTRRPSLRHRLSKAGLRRLFSKKDGQSQEKDI